jgi:hypothetical protein
MKLPFEQHIIENKLIRTFSPDVENEELKWHKDLKDRKVTIIESGGWEFQMDDHIPINLDDTKELWIPKLVWHRVIKGKGNLIVEIEEF